MDIMTSKFLIYFHGFNSSPASKKAMLMKDFIASHYPDITFIAPQITAFPLLALQQVQTIVDDILLETPNADIGFVGSSMGGFLATLCSEKYERYGVLINPAVAPHKLIKSIIGEHVNPYTNDIYNITLNHADELQAMNFDTLIAPAKLWILLQQGDETLDYREAVETYRGARVTIEPQGNHSFVGFERFLNATVQFLFHQ